MPGRFWLSCGATLAGLGVAAGALGAHALKDVLPSEQLHNFEVAVRYQMYHAFGLIVVGLLARHACPRAMTVAGSLFLLGEILFSGGLYGWIFTSVGPLVHVVPIGGLAWIVGWAALAWGAYCGPSGLPIVEKPAP